MLKKLKTVFVAILAGIGGLVVLWGSTAAISYLVQKEDLPDAALLALHLEGEMRESRPADAVGELITGGGLVLGDVVEALARAQRDPRVRGLLVRIGSVRMGMAHIQEIRDAIAAFRRSGKPAFAYADTFGEFGPGTAAYYLATACDEIWMQPSGDLNMTGLIEQTPFIRGVLDKLGVVPRFDHRKEYKNFMNIFTETAYTDAHQEAVASRLAALREQIVRGIAAARDLDAAAVNALMDEGPFSGADALAGKLVDKLAYRDELDEAVEERLEVKAEQVDPGRYLRLSASRFRKGPVIAVIHGEGGIQRGKSHGKPLTGESVMGADTIAAAFRDAVADAQVKAILFRVNSPGGSYVASDTIWRAVRRAGDMGKPVVVSMGNLAASGGYFVSIPAWRIVAQPGTLTGSVGVIAGKMVIREFWERLGVSWDSVKTGENADLWSSLEDYSPEQWRWFQAWLDRIYDDFTQKVAQGRHLEIQRVQEIAKGRVWTGAAAKELGLVDALGGYTCALELVREAAGLAPDAPVRLRAFPDQGGWLRRIIRRLDGVRGLPGGAGPAGWIASLQEIFRSAAHQVLPADQPLELPRQQTAF